MKLREYLKSKKISSKDFAKLVGCSKTLISQFINDKAKPGRFLKQIISLKTNGEVRFDEELIESNVE